ncbi:hypothetical protein F5Y16DRAFT_114286 [Xylariaceae sp. FL0255]|nr:hypothetical protein F5Y16DRAFT_114286 [Xylariaceae sp. FL0255]
MTETANLGALTTPFVQPASCSLSLSYNFKYFTHSPSYYLLQGPLDQTSCLPSGYDGSSNQYFSPGVCPLGYTAACTDKSTVGSATETIYTCCPTQYQYDCQILPTNQLYVWQSTQACTITSDSNGFSIYSDLVVVTDNSVIGVTTSLANFKGGMNAYGVEVRFKSGDDITTSSIGSQLPTTSGSGSCSQTLTLPLQTVTETISGQGQKGAGLSTGTAAGIGVASGVSVIALIGAAIFFWLGIRERKRTTAEHQADVNADIATHAAADWSGVNEKSG